MISVLFFMLMAISATSFAQGWRAQEMEIKITIHSTDELIRLYNLKLNCDEINSIPGTTWAYIIPEELKKIQQSGLSYTISIPDLNSRTSNTDGTLVPNGYMTCQQVDSFADSLETAYPNLVKRVFVGTSVQNRDMVTIKLSDNPGEDEAEPEVWFQCGIHGDEIGPTENGVRLARELCKKYGSDTLMTRLLNQRETYICLMVNPDGRNAMSRYNTNGIDINRDGGYMWNGEGNSTAPFSAKESKALRDFLNSRHFTVCTDYHSGTIYLSFPWSYRAAHAPDFTHIQSLGNVYANASGYSSLPVGQGYSGMYPINGSTKDQNYGANGSIAWSMEISELKQPPASQITYYYNQNKNAMLQLINKAGLGICGMVTDTAGNSIPARLTIENTMPFYNDPIKADFQKYLTPGTYTLYIEANGYEPKTISDIVVDENNATYLKIELTPNQSTGWAGRIITSYIPNNNFSDEGATWAAIGHEDGKNYSIGKYGYVIIDAIDTLVNLAGPDFKVYEGDNTPEAYSVAIALSIDGPWQSLGEATGTATFDLEGSTLSKAKYIKITDIGSGASMAPDAGFDLDAIELLNVKARAAFCSNKQVSCAGESVNFSSLSTGNPTTYQWLFEGGIPASSTEPNPQNIKYKQPGSYPVSLTVSNGFGNSVLLRSSYISVLELPIVDIGNDTLIDYSSSIILDAGEGAASYLWSNQATTQIQEIDTAWLGPEGGDVWVKVTAMNQCTNSDTLYLGFAYIDGIQVASNQNLSINVIKTNNSLSIEWPQQQLKRLLVYNLQGQLMEVILLNGTSKEEAKLKTLQKQMAIILVIESDKSRLSEKLIW